MYTSEQLESLDIEEFETITEQCTFKYRLTDGEHGWLEWIGQRYTIACVLFDNMESIDEGLPTEHHIVTIDVSEIGQALIDDGVDKAPCLCDNTQLQRLIWYIGPNEY